MNPIFNYRQIHPADHKDAIAEPADSFKERQCRFINEQIMRLFSHFTNAKLQASKSAKLVWKVKALKTQTMQTSKHQNQTRENIMNSSGFRPRMNFAKPEMAFNSHMQNFKNPKLQNMESESLKTSNSADLNIRIIIIITVMRLMRS